MIIQRQGTVELWLVGSMYIVWNGKHDYRYTIEHMAYDKFRELTAK